VLRIQEHTHVRRREVNRRVSRDYYANKIRIALTSRCKLCIESLAQSGDFFNFQFTDPFARSVCDSFEAPKRQQLERSKRARTSDPRALSCRTRWLRTFTRDSSPDIPPILLPAHPRARTHARMHASLVRTALVRSPILLAPHRAATRREKEKKGHARRISALLAALENVNRA